MNLTPKEFNMHLANFTEYVATYGLTNKLCFADTIGLLVAVSARTTAAGTHCGAEGIDDLFIESYKYTYQACLNSLLKEHCDA